MFYFVASIQKLLSQIYYDTKGHPLQKSSLLSIPTFMSRVFVSTTFLWICSSCNYLTIVTPRCILISDRSLTIWIILYILLNIFCHGQSFKINTQITTRPCRGINKMNFINSMSWTNVDDRPTSLPHTGQNDSVKAVILSNVNCFNYIKLEVWIPGTAQRGTINNNLKGLYKKESTREEGSINMHGSPENIHGILGVSKYHQSLNEKGRRSP